MCIESCNIFCRSNLDDNIVNVPRAESFLKKRTYNFVMLLNPKELKALKLFYVAKLVSIGLFGFMLSLLLNSQQTTTSAIAQGSFLLALVLMIWFTMDRYHTYLRLLIGKQE